MSRKLLYFGILFTSAYTLVLLSFSPEVVDNILKKSFYQNKSSGPAPKGVVLGEEEQAIDIYPPTYSGVTNETTYTAPITIFFSDVEGPATATLDGTPFESGSIVSDLGSHTLVISDAAINVVTVNFTIAEPETVPTESDSADETASTSDDLILPEISDSPYIPTSTPFEIPPPMPEDLNPPTSTTETSTPALAANTEPITAEKTFTENTIRVEIIAPPGAATASTTFGIETADPAAYKNPLASLNAALVGLVFDLTAKDDNNQPLTSFNQPLAVSFTLTGQMSDLSNLGVYYYDDSEKKWQQVLGAEFDAASEKVTFATSHLTVFAVFRVAGVPAALATVDSVLSENPIPPPPETPPEVPAFTGCENIDFGNGDLIKSNLTDKVYVIINGRKKLIKTRARLASLVSTVVADEILDCFPGAR